MSEPTERTPTAQNPLADRKRWSIRECRKLEVLEILEEDRYELLDGAIVLRLARSFRHAVVQGRLFHVLLTIFGADFVLFNCCCSIDDENEPEADMLVLNRPSESFMGRGNPKPRDVHLIVELSEETLWRDQHMKRLIFARAGVPEY